MLETIPISRFTRVVSLRSRPAVTAWKIRRDATLVLDVPWEWPVCLPFWVGLEKANTKQTNKTKNRPPSKARTVYYSHETAILSDEKDSVKMRVGGRLCPKRTSYFCPLGRQKELEITIRSSPRVNSAFFEDVFKLMGRVQRLWGGQSVLWPSCQEPHSHGTLAHLRFFLAFPGNLHAFMKALGVTYPAKLLGCNPFKPF